MIPLSPQILRHFQIDIPISFSVSEATYVLLSHYLTDSEYFTENILVKENETKMRNIHPRFFHLISYGLKLGFRLGFGLRFDLEIVLE